MGVINCKRCRKIFTAEHEVYCTNCINLEKENFNKVKEFLRTRKNCNVMEVSKGTGIPASKILDYMREGRIDY
ncbi:MAG: hypothetical protein FWG65_10560 [Turicibacter sp.]|nr:hypothetical protein [Turicibacter sp.]